jgi:uncharacterized RDD family membrane protein YckC
MTGPRYYYSRDRQVREGPLPIEGLRELAVRGLLLREHLVWAEGMAEWAAAATVPGLFDGAPPPVPQPDPGLVVDEPVWEEPVYAGFWLRVVAAIIDGIILAIPGACLNHVLGAALGLSMSIFGPLQNQDLVRMTAYYLINALLGTIINWLYYALMESSAHQATLGKMALGLKVTTMDLGRVGFGRATGRYFAKILSSLTMGVGYVMAGFTERKQGLHDMIAGCLVVRARM